MWEDLTGYEQKRVSKLAPQIEMIVRRKMIYFFTCLFYFLSTKVIWSMATASDFTSDTIKGL